MSAPARTRPPVDRRFIERRREVARESVVRRRRLLLSIVAMIALAAGGIGVAQSPLFVVEGVVVSGVSGEQAEEVEAVARVPVGDQLLSVDLGRVAARVEVLPWVRSAEARRVPPSRIEVIARPRVPVAVVEVRSVSWLVDSDGVVVAEGSAPGLPVIAAPGAVMPGLGAQVTDGAITNALAVRADIPADLAARVVRYDASSATTMRIWVRGPDDQRVWVRMGRAEQLDEKAEVLAALLDQVGGQAEGVGLRGIAEVDVRVPEHPVIVPRDS